MDSQDLFGNGGDGGQPEILVRVLREEMVCPATRKKKKKKKKNRSDCGFGREGEGEEGEEEGEEEEEEEEMFLSAMDIMCREMPFNRRLLFYELSLPPGPGPHYEQMVSNLKHSLGLALDAFYPLAGRIIMHADVPMMMMTMMMMTMMMMDHRHMRLACNDMGASFIEATVEGCITIADLRCNGSFSSTQPRFFDQLVPWVEPADYASVPPLLVQVSRFDCGGIALGIAHSHIICDGNSLWHFMTSWAECARGEPISMPPVHTRSLLKIENPSPSKAMLILEHVEDEEKKDIEGNHKKINTFRFEKATIERLKMKIRGENTTYETICAHIWKHVTKAREHSRDKKVAFISVVNMRERVEPPIGNAYFGNALMWTTAVATVGELENEDLATTAQRIHRSILACNTDAFFNLLHWLEVYDRDVIFKTCTLNGARLRASSSPNFPIFKIDFGWGKPCVVRCPRVDDAGKVIFFPGSDVHGNVIDAVLALPPDIMNRLEIDQSFMNP